MSGTYEIDFSKWPMVVHRVAGDLTDEQVDAYMLQGTEVLMRKQPHVAILDTRKLGRVSAYTRARNAEWQRRYAAELKQYCLGTAYVISSPLLRFITMTVLLIGRLPTPYRVCETPEDAEAWCATLLHPAEP